jgi:hypothetical protein
MPISRKQSPDSLSASQALRKEKESGSDHAYLHESKPDFFFSFSTVFLPKGHPQLLMYRDHRSYRLHEDRLSLEGYNYPTTKRLPSFAALQMRLSN